MIDVTIQVRGIKEIRGALKAMEPEQSFKEIRTALRLGMKPALKATKALVKAEAFDSGAWLASLGSATATQARIKRGREGYGIVGRASVVTRTENKRVLAIYNAKRKKPIAGLYYILIEDEYGVKGRPPRRIMARALASVSSDVTSTFAKTLATSLEGKWQRRT